MTLVAEKFGTQTKWHSVDTVSTDSSKTAARVVPAVKGAKPAQAADQAVFSHLKALRALGKTRVRASDVAMALGLSEKEVRRVLAGMSDRGVKAL